MLGYGSAWSLVLVLITFVTFREMLGSRGPEELLEAKENR